MAATQTSIARIESFPFDSSPDGYDDDGYPIYDRAVGAQILRDVFGRFFTGGVFGTPADALEIGKGESGLVATVKPGMFIINGAMGGISGDDPMTVTLDAEAPKGKIAYGIMLRYNESDDTATGENVGRSLSIRVVKGDASADPTPPAPDRETPGVYEYRLGYVTVPSGATDLSGATVTNEKGTEVCPYAAPFEEIDLSAVVNDAKGQAAQITEAVRQYGEMFKNNVNQSISELEQYLNENMEFIDSAINGTTAGHLQQQIDAIKIAELTDLDIQTIWGDPYSSSGTDQYVEISNQQIDDMFVGGQVINE